MNPGTKLGRYQIRSKIGEGGMGEVYLAQDTRLDRKVALKILPANVAADRSRMNRFVQEAKAASALNHPNIITIYEIDETDSGHFIATEFIDGETVRDCLRETPLTISEALNVAAQVAAALAAAHRAGIIHRDIKPENVMVRADGLVKVLDFGLAKLTAAGASEPESATRIQSDTQPGMIMGTVAYMSPEQARGKPLDARTDVWSLGVLLYEMLSRRSPFLGESASDTLANILHREPDALNLGALPNDLARIVQTMLAKRLEARYPAMADAILDLKSLQRQIEFDSEMQQTVMRSLAETHTEMIVSATASKPVNETAADSASSRPDEGFWVAVLPFEYRGKNADLGDLALGLSEDIIAGLSRFSCLRVIARSSTLRFTKGNGDVRLIGQQLGARYVMDGSLRQAGSRLRLMVQLVDASTGAHLWAETYDRSIDNEKLFAIQDDLVPRIVSTVADWYGVLTHSMSEAVRQKPLDQLTPYEALLRSFGYYERVTAEEQAAARFALEKAVEQAPSNADAWAMLSMICGEEHRFDYNVLPDPLGRSLQAARRAVSIAPTNHFAHLALAQALFFRKEFEAFRTAAERAIALNPMDGATVQYLAHLICFSGDWDYGCQLAEQTRQLNPNHPGWYWAVPFFNAYRNGDYVTARAFVMKGEMANYLWSVMLGALYGQLGERELAERAIGDVLALVPDFTQTARSILEKWYPPDLVESLIEGLRKAGLEIEGVSADRDLRVTSHESRLDEGFWVAVLPFKYRGADADLEALAEGLSEDIVTGLSRFSYLRVIARTSMLRLTSEAIDVSSAGKELGARYVIEGSLRQAGSKLRLAVQLVDATSGAHLWAENYERSFDPDSIFELQDDLVPRIVSTVADQYGALVHSMSESLRGRSAGQYYSAHQAVLRAFGYSERITPEEHRELREILEAAVATTPDHSDCLALLSMVYWHEYAHGYNVKPDSLGRALTMAQRAVAAAPTNHLAHHLLATVYFFQKNFLAFRPAADRALALNSMDASTIAFLGILIAYSGDWEDGLGLTERAMELNPHHAGWYHFAAFHHAYYKRDYRGALEIALKINMPGYFFMHAALAAVYGQLGEQERARAALRELHALMPNFGALGRDEYAKWLDAAHTEHIMEGLRKAGLEIVDKDEVSNPGPATEMADTHTVPGFGGRPAIAVLPFDNLSADPDQEYFADGLAEDLITRLSLWRSFPVIARNSSFVYKGKSVDIKKVSADLRVRYVVEGSVRKGGNRVRISAQLIDATTGQHVWAKTYDRELTDVFAVQDEISGAIAASLIGDLQHAEHDRVQHRAPENLEAWDLFQRALPLIYRFTQDDSARARALLERAIALDPKFSTARARLAEVGVWDFIFGWSASPQQTLDAAVAQARRAVDLDPRNAEARSELAFALMTAGFGDEALEAARHGLDLNPCMPFAMIVEGYLRNLSGNPPEKSIELMERAKQLSPHDPTEFLFYDILSASYMNAGRYAEGLAAGRRLVALMPNYYWGYLWSAMNAVGLGRLEEARALIHEARQVHPGLSLTLARQALGAMAPEVDHRFFEALRQAGLEEPEEIRPRDTATHFAAPVTDDKLKYGARMPSIAVLPFVNISNDPDNDYFCDGLAEELLNALAKIDDLKVAARTSAFSFKGKNADVTEIANALNVKTVLEGSVRKSANRVRITTQLINAADGYHLWSERYDREMKDIFDVQDEITLAVVEALKVKLLGKQKSAVLKRHTRSPEALEFYLRGLSYFTRFTPEYFQKAIESFDQAITIDPDYASAYAGLAECYSEMSFFASAGGWMPKARAAARKALELDDTLGNAHNSLAVTLMYYDRNFTDAEAEFKRAIALDPGSAHIHMWYGWFLALTRRFDEGLREMKRAQEFDPLAHLISFGIGATYLWSGQPERAIEQLGRVVELNPNFRLAYSYLAEAYLEKGEFASAVATIENAPIAFDDDPVSFAASAHVYAKAGDRHKALEILSELKSRPDQEFDLPVHLAQVYVGLGDNDQAYAWLEKACAELSVWLIWLGVDPAFNPLRPEPRFKELLRRVGLAQ